MSISLFRSAARRSNLFSCLSNSLSWRPRSPGGTGRDGTRLDSQTVHDIVKQNQCPAQHNERNSPLQLCPQAKVKISCPFEDAIICWCALSTCGPLKALVKHSYRNDCILQKQQVCFCSPAASRAAQSPQPSTLLAVPASKAFTLDQVSGLNTNLDCDCRYAFLVLNLRYYFSRITIWSKVSRLLRLKAGRAVFREIDLNSLKILSVRSPGFPIWGFVRKAQASSWPGKGC